MRFSLNKKISDKTSQNKDLSQCDIAISQIRGPQKILCTFGEKEHTSKRVSIIVCNNVISKAQCATHRRERTPYERMHCILHIMRIPFREILTSLRSSE